MSNSENENMKEIKVELTEEAYGKIKNDIGLKKGLQKVAGPALEFVHMVVSEVENGNNEIILESSESE